MYWPSDIVNYLFPLFCDCSYSDLKICQITFGKAFSDLRVKLAIVILYFLRSQVTIFYCKTHFTQMTGILRKQKKVSETNIYR